MESAAMSELSETALLGREVAVTRIERAFKELWENDEASTKATLLNLVCFSTSPGSLLRNHHLAARLTRDHACRVLLIEATPGAPTRAWISAHCHLTGGKKSVCSEQIALQLDSTKPGLARNTLLGLLPSDLPVVLWWQGPLDEAFEPGLYWHVDRLLIDSAEWEFSTVAAQLSALQAARAKMGRPFAIHDLAWTRTYPFRIAMAALFDHPHAEALMGGLREGKMTVAPGFRACGALLAAWVARALGWKPAGALAEGWVFRDTGGNEIRFLCREEEGAEAVGAVELGGAGGGVAVVRAPGDCHLRASIEDGSELPPLILPAGCEGTAGLVEEMLSRGGKNSLHAAVLPILLAMAKG